jgi:hypothetical protein
MDHAGTGSRKRQGTLVFEKTGEFTGLDFKMKSEITPLVYNFNCDGGFTNQTDQKD